MTSFPPFQPTATTGAGYSGLAGIIGALATGHMTWEQAAVVAVPTIVLLLFPEQNQLSVAAGATAADVEKLIAAYKMGLVHRPEGGGPLA